MPISSISARNSENKIQGKDNMLSTSRPGAKNNFSDQQSRRARRSDSTSSPRPGTNVVHRKSSGKMDSPAKKITGPTAIRGQNVDRFLPVRRTSRPGISVLHETERRLERSFGGGPANKITEAIEKKREETVDIVGSSEKPPDAPISTGVSQHLIQKAHRMAIGKRQTIVVGPWGGSGGNGWDDGSYDGIREIQISHRDTIGSLSVVYDWNGEPFAGPKHTSIHPLKNEKIELEFPDEFLVSVSGHTAPLSWLGTKTPVIRSLTFETNKRIFGPYGAEEGTTFNFPIENGLIVGFKGRSGELLDAIGFHLSI